MLKKILVITGFFVGLIGAALVSYGAWMATPAAGFITGGSLCLFWSWMVSRALGRDIPPTKPQGDD